MIVKVRLICRNCHSENIKQVSTDSFSCASCGMINTLKSVEIAEVVE